MRLRLLLAFLLAAPRAEAFWPWLEGPADAAWTCAAASASWGESALCLRDLALGPEGRAAAACALRGHEPLQCVGVEIGILGACVYGAGPSWEVLTGCVALKSAGYEAAKCLTHGIGTPGGCFGPDHELRRWARALWGGEGWTGRLRARALAWLPGSWRPWGEDDGSACGDGADGAGGAVRASQ